MVLTHAVRYIYRLVVFSGNEFKFIVLFSPFIAVRQAILAPSGFIPAPLNRPGVLTEQHAVKERNGENGQSITERQARTK